MRKQMKKIISLLMVFLITFTINSPIFATDMTEFIISVGNVVAEKGQYVEVPVYYNNIPNTGIMGNVLVIDYDETKLELTEDNILPGELITDPQTDFTANIDAYNRAIVWFADESLGGRIITNNGVFAKLRFKVLDTAEIGTYDIKIVESRGVTTGDLKEIKNYTTYVDGSIQVIPAPVRVTGVSLNVTNKTLNVGDKFNLIATINPNDATNKNVEWTSSNLSVAKVSTTGEVLAVGIGTATITVKTLDGNFEATCNIEVNEKVVTVTGVSLDKNELKLNVGQNYQLNATVEPSDATNKQLIWTSEDTSVATVDNTGKVVGVASGATTITVRTIDGDYEASCSVVVDDGNKPVINSASLDTNIEGLGIKAIIKDGTIDLAVPSIISTLTDGHISLSENIYSAHFISENINVTLYNLTSETLRNKLVGYFGTQTAKDFLLSLNGATLELTDYVGNKTTYKFNIYNLLSSIDVNISNVVAFDNTEVDVKVALDKIPSTGISVANFSLVYDKDKFEFVSVTKESAAGSMDYHISEVGKINFLLEELKNGDILTVKFKVKGVGAFEKSNLGPFEVTFDNDFEFADELLNKYGLNINKGVIDIYRYGDVNHDGYVNSKDVLEVKEYLLKRKTEFTNEYCKIAADIDKTNTVTAIDYLAIKQFTLGKRSELPVK